MQVYKDLDQLPSFNKAVITIGTFDGVHLGHRQIIERLKSEAAAIKGETVIITFHPHPRKVVASASVGIRIINTLNEKLQLLQELGIDHVVVVPFTDAFAHQPAEDYVKDFLIAKFTPHTIIIGYDHRFGRNREGDYLLLEKMSPQFGYCLKEIPKHLLENISISSTNIRQAILQTDIEAANKLLGYLFFFSGIVVHGDKLGRQLGYPTANLKIEDEEKITPADGIYAVYAEIMDSEHSANNRQQSTATYGLLKGMMSIGFRPTVNGKKRMIEVNIFNFSDEIYDQTLIVYVKKYLRAEEKFNGLDALVKQIDQDKIDSLQVL